MRLLSKTCALLMPPLLLGAFLTASCARGGSPQSPAPSPVPAPSPTPSGPLPNLSGNWVGTLESPGFATRTISARFSQFADCVDGSWDTGSSESRWIGAISGFARPGSFSGFMSFEIPGSGSKLCSGVGNLAGDATDDTATLMWDLTSYSTDSCTSVPNPMTLKLQRP
jgi:hypothetical protein